MLPDVVQVQTVVGVLCVYPAPGSCSGVEVVAVRGYTYDCEDARESPQCNDSTEEGPLREPVIAD